MLSKKTLLKEKDWQRIDAYFSQNKNLCAFCSYPTMEMYFNSARKEVHLLENEDGLRFVSVTKNDWRDTRVLFDHKHHDDELMEKLIKTIRPLHIGHAHVQKPKAPWSDCKPYQEVVIDLQEVASLKGKKLASARNKYNKFTREVKDFEIVFDGNKKKYKSLLHDFFTKWVNNQNAEAKKRGLPERYDGIFDFEFLDNLHGKRDQWGSFIIQNDEIIAVDYTTYHPSDKNYCIGFMGKNLRVHPGLATYLLVEVSKKMLDKGFTKNNMGGWQTETEAKFKLNFSSREQLFTTYYYTYHSPDPIVWMRSF